MSRIQANILAVEPANDGSYVRFADGRTMGDVNIAVDSDTIEGMRQGYICIRCYEPQSEPFPEVCESTLPNGVRWCNFPMRARQAIEFAQTYDGEVHVGSRINRSDELERLRELDEYESRTGIVLPDHVKFPTGQI